jgi:hypothetical protein
LNMKDVETYQIDVIVEKYLPNYLKIIDSELNAIISTLKKCESNTLFTIKKIVEEANALKEKPQSYREILEYEY